MVNSQFNKQLRYRLSIYLTLILIIVLPIATLAGEKSTLSGTAGLYGELNSISGHEKRRPDALGRLFFRPTVTFANGFDIRFNINISTEGSSSRQDISEFGFTPRWSWGELYVGDFSKDFTPLTLQGIKIRGGGFTITPGKFQLSVISGRTQRAVSSPTDNRTYQRNLSGVQLGIGKDTGNNFKLSVVSVKDDPASLAELVNDTTMAVDTMATDSTDNPDLSVTPQENLVLSTAGNLSLVDNHINIKTELAASAYTRDRRASKIESADIPNFLADIFTPRISSNADFAYSTNVEYTRRTLSLEAGHEFIGPGYMSLGLASNVADRRTSELGMRYRLKRGMFRIHYQHQSNNLIDQKNSTTVRNRVTGNLNLRMTNYWSVTFNTSYSTMNNQLTDSLGMVDNSSLFLRIGQTVRRPKSPLTKSIYVEYSFQQSNEKNELRTNADLQSHGLSFRLTSDIHKQITVNTSLSFITTKHGTSGWSDVRTLGVTSRWTEPVHRHSISLMSTYTTLTGGSVARIELRGDYKMSKKITFRLGVLSNYSRSDDNQNNFDEYSGRLTMTYSFGN